MRVLAAVALLVLAHASSECPNAPPVPADRRSDPSKLRVMQFNAEWLFIDQFGDCPGTGCPWADQAAVQTHLESIASVIAALNPDIVNFCEVEGCNELGDVIEEVGPAYGYVPYLKQGDDTATGQNVGIITRVDPVESLQKSSDKVSYPVPTSTCAADAGGSTGTKGCSKHYFTSFEVNSMKIVMIGAHLLAYPDDPYRCVQREAQATVLRDIIDDYMNSGYEVIVIGDLNDFEIAPTDVNDNLPISQVLNILRGVGTENELVNAAALMDKSQRYTDWWDEDDNCVYEDDEVSMIDHILISQNLVNFVDKVFVAHDAYPQICDSTYSDHWPVVIDFDFAHGGKQDDDANNNDDDDSSNLSSAGIGLIAAGVVVFVGFTIFTARRYFKNNDNSAAEASAPTAYAKMEE